MNNCDTKRHLATSNFSEVRHFYSGNPWFFCRKDSEVVRGAGLFEAFKGHTSECRQRTLEQWEIRGELSAMERQQLIQLLCQIDGQACLDHCSAADQQDR